MKMVVIVPGALVLEMVNCCILAVLLNVKTIVAMAQMTIAKLAVAVAGKHNIDINDN